MSELTVERVALEILRLADEYAAASCAIAIFNPKETPELSWEQVDAAEYAARDALEAKINELARRV